jgi:ArsR family transcriptional regulator
MEKKIAILFKALSDENRLKVLELLLKGETCSCTLIDQLPITQPTLSYHLKWLNEVGLTTSYKEGTSVKYKVNKEKLADMIDYLIQLRDMEATSCSL